MDKKLRTKHMRVSFLVCENILVEEEGNATKDVPQQEEEECPRMLQSYILHLVISSRWIHWYCSTVLRNKQFIITFSYKAGLQKNMDDCDTSNKIFMIY